MTGGPEDPMTDTPADRVARGAALLDRTDPGWHLLIDLAALNLADPCRCVLGQIDGDYNERILQRAGTTNDASLRWSRHHGFNNGEFNSARRSAEWEALDEAWIAEAKRRVNASDATVGVS